MQFVQGIINAFPDGKIAAVRVFGAGDWGCCQFAFEGTNTGPLGNPDGSEVATDRARPRQFPYCVVARFEDGLWSSSTSTSTASRCWGSSAWSSDSSACSSASTRLPG